MPASVTPSEPTGPDLSRNDRPLGLRVVLVGTALEVLLLLAVVVAIGGELVTGGSSSVGVSIFLALFFLGLAWVLFTCARALWHGRRSGRTPVAVWQVLQGLVGISLLTADPVWAVLAGVLLFLVAAVVLVLLMTRRVVKATAG